jgi:hypothetical protein
VFENIINDKIYAAPATWGSVAISVELLHFVLFWTVGSVMGQEGAHPIAVAIFFFAWLFGIYRRSLRHRRFIQG